MTAAVANFAGDARSRFAEADLTDYEMVLLSRYLYDRQTQREIGSADGTPRRTVSFRIHVAARKLERIGVPVELPGRGRRKERADEAVTDPHDMTRLLVRRGTDGRQVGRWIDAHKAERPSDEIEPRRRGRRWV
jgi:hypothetical protein